MQTYKTSGGSIFAHPIFIFVGSWTFVYFLYSLSLSYLLIYDIRDFWYVYALTVVPFLVGYGYARAMIFGMARGRKPGGAGSFNLGRLEPHAADAIWRRLRGLLNFWVVATMVEIGVSGGIPILWILTGSSKNYQDFGVQSVHGLLMSVLMACATTSFYLYLETRNKKYLAVPVCAMLWFVVSITRGFLVGIIFQMLFLYLSAIRPKPSQIIKIAVGFLFLILFFGVAGDLRSEGGGDLIRAVAEPTERFPDWLPSGFLWVYIYLATPLNNLFNTIQLSPSSGEISIAVTTSQLFPTVLRNLIFTGPSFGEADLVSGNLNISTGLIGPYLDMGLPGVVFFCIFLGIVASWFWTQRNKTFYFLGCAFIAQALALSIFYDIMLFLPFLFQLFWFWFLLRAKKLRFTSKATRDLAVG